jgi:hypothetical protein
MVAILKLPPGVSLDDIIGWGTSGLVALLPGGQTLGAAMMKLPDAKLKLRSMKPSWDSGSRQANTDPASVGLAV